MLFDYMRCCVTGRAEAEGWRLLARATSPPRWPGLGFETRL